MKSLPIFTAGAALLALPFLTGCQHTGSVRTVTDADNGGTITLGSRDRLEVLLHGNPSTGYTWQTLKINSWVLSPLGRPAFTPGPNPGSDEPRVGAAGTFRFVYQTLGTGSSPLELAYARPWEPDSDPSRTFKITVVVSR